MFHYSMIQWLFFFYMYSFFGWCFESTYVSLKSKRWVNRGFMKGPFLPLYGSGAIMMLVVSRPFMGNIFLVYVAGCIGATALEYVTGVTMEALFKVRYWDYSYKKYNFQGHICLGSSIAWGFFTILMTHVIHTPIEQAVLGIPNQVLEPVVFLTTIVLVVDFTLAFKAAMDLRDILIKLEKAQQELEHMQKRLDVMIAVAADERAQRREEFEKKKEEFSEQLEERLEQVAGKVEARKEYFSENLEDRVGRVADSLGGRLDRAFDSVESKLNQMRDNVKKSTSLYLEEAREELAEIRMKFHVQRESHRSLTDTLGTYKKSLIRNNPGMVSPKFATAFEELKKIAYKKQHDEADSKQEEG